MHNVIGILPRFEMLSANAPFDHRHAVHIVKRMQ
jgi:hypothetical protein